MPSRREHRLARGPEDSLGSRTAPRTFKRLMFFFFFVIACQQYAAATVIFPLARLLTAISQCELHNGHLQTECMTAAMDMQSSEVLKAGISTGRCKTVEEVDGKSAVRDKFTFVVESATLQHVGHVQCKLFLT